jgi:hypothetical protein
MGSDHHFARQQFAGANVRFGSKADIPQCPSMSALPSKADMLSVIGMPVDCL